MKQTFRRRAATAMAVGAMILGTGATAAFADAPSDGLLAQYAFGQTTGSEVSNTAPGSPFGAAIVRNVQDADWAGDALTLRGGAKDGPGNWVELPDDLLKGETSATVIAEVKASEAMLGGFHFLWNIGNESSATEYFFASLNCGSGRSPLVGLKAAGAERLVQSGSCGVTADRWVNVASVVDADGTGRLYLDGALVAEGALGATPADIVDQSLNTIGRAPWPDPLFQGALSSFRVYDRALTAAEVADVSAADALVHADELRAEAQGILDGLGLSDLETSDDIDLPTAGGQVTWTSSDPAIVAPDGAVTPPLQGESAVEVTLTATVEIRGASASTSIAVTVLPSDETPAQRIERLAQRFVIPSVVASGTALPAAPEGVDIAVTAVSEGLTVHEAISTDADEPVDGEISVTATDAATGASATRTYAVRVLPADASTPLLAYDRLPTTAAEANNADIALSMHLALGQDGGWAPLNENYGVFFAKTAQTPGPNGTTEAILRSLRSPHLFYLEDGSFGIVATRTARGGGSDGTQSGRMLFARSTDLLSYQEVGLVDLGVTSGVNDPAVVWDSATRRYVVSWTSDGGAAMHTTFADLADAATRGPVERGAVSATAGESETGVEDYASGNAIAVTDDVASALQVRFGRIANTTVAPLDGVDVAAGAPLEASALPPRAELAYDDGSTATRAIDWDPASLAAVDTSTPGTYEVTGTIAQQAYPTPFADERADPSVFRYEWNGQTKFLMIATEDLHMNPIDPANGPHMPFRIADTIEDLSDEAIRSGRNTEVGLLRDGDVDAYGKAMTGCFWAPEFHVIDGTLSILFMPCYDGANGRPDMWTGRSSIIQLKKDAQGNDLDPAVPANWTKAEHVVRADGTALNAAQGISLDMTYVEDSGQSYYVWQMLGSVFIATMDPSDPTRITSDPVRIVVPEYAWDNVIAEGPNVLAHDGTLFLIYSGSTVGDTYTTGLATATAGEGIDLTDPAAWTKLNYPIQKSGPFNGAWQLGTGHGMWSTDEDGNLLYVFHARTDNLGLTGRDTFVRRVHWASDGMPVFDQEADEEVAPANRAVSVEVTVGEPALALEAEVGARCVAGRVVQTVTVENEDDTVLTATVTSPYGVKTKKDLAPGARASVSFTTRQAAIPAGSVEVAAEGADGTSAVREIAYEASTCG
ncbi:family 43 glycosylhydrolase [Microbacterium sp. KNMS]